MRFILIFVAQVSLVNCEDKIIKSEENKISLFRRTLKPKTLAHTLRPDLTSHSNFTNITLEPSGHVWFEYDENEKEWKQVYKPTFSVVYYKPNIFDSAWLFVKETCYDIVVATKSLVIGVTKLTLYLGRRLIPFP